MFSVKKKLAIAITSLSLMYCVNLAEISHTHQSTINACLKNSII